MNFKSRTSKIVAGAFAAGTLMVAAAPASADYYSYYYGEPTYRSYTYSYPPAVVYSAPTYSYYDTYPSYSYAPAYSYSPSYAYPSYGYRDSYSYSNPATTAAGAIAGAVIGSQFGSGSGRIAGAGIGALLGGVVGSELGSGPRY
jgi:hypothetical protein